MNENNLLQEVDDALRHDAMVALWNRYRKLIFIGVAAIVLGTGGSEAWKAYQSHRAGEATFLITQGQASFAKAEYAEAAHYFGKAIEAAPVAEMKDMALLWQGRAYLNAGKRTEGIASLARLAEYPKSNNLLWRDLACVTVMGVAPENNKCLAAQGPSPLQQNRQLLSAAQDWQAGKSQAAKTTLEALRADEKTPAALRAVAQEWLAVME